MCRVVDNFAEFWSFEFGCLVLVGFAKPVSGVVQWIDWFVSGSICQVPAVSTADISA